MKKTTMTRREVMRLSAAAGTLLLGRRSGALGSFRAAAPMVPGLDHILWGARDLDEGIRTIEEKTGVKAVFGGVHPHRGTRNALLSLGERQYLEILSLDPEQNVDAPRVDELKSLIQPRILTWAAATTDVETVEKNAKAAGLESSGIMDGSRQKPDGTLLRWRSLTLGGHDDTVVPFLIEWHPESVHPSEDSPRGCTLKEVRLEHPESEKMNTFLEAAGVDLRVMEGASPKITALIDTPEGELELT